MQKIDWTLDKQLELKQLADKGYTARGIAAVLSISWLRIVTPNTVIGRMNRTGVTFKHGLTFQGKKRKRIPLIKLGIPFIKLTPYRCAWPLWPEYTDEHQCCGERTLEKRRYCLKHFNMSVTPAHRVKADPDPVFTAVKVPANPEKSKRQWSTNSITASWSSAR